MKKVFKALPLDIAGMIDLECTVKSIKKGALSDIGKTVFDGLLMEDQYMILIKKFALVNLDTLKQVMVNA